MKTYFPLLPVMVVLTLGGRALRLRGNDKANP